jgi:hypothetical protein
MHADIGYEACGFMSYPNWSPDDRVARAIRVIRPASAFQIPACFGAGDQTPHMRTTRHYCVNMFDRDLLRLCSSRDINIERHRA